MDYSLTIKRKELSDKVTTLKFRKAQIEAELASLKAQAEEAIKQHEFLGEVQLFLQTIAEDLRSAITSKLESVVTMCIQSVFGENYSFRIVPDTKRKVTVLDFFVVDHTGDEEIMLQPEDNFGGGMIDTIAIGLRFAMLKVVDNIPKAPMILDEPSKMVSADRAGAISKLIKELRDIYDIQVIMVTHSEELAELSDNTLYFYREGNKTKVG